MKKIPLPNTRRRFEVARDDNGVPHVRGATWLDALFGLGYMHATDRPTQLLFSRSVASGHAAEEIAGTPEMFETDGFFRRIGLNLDLDTEVRNLDDRTFSQLTAYCEGVNDGLKDSGRSLPMWATGFQPQPWNQQAVLLIGKLLSFGGLAVGQMQNERLLLELIHAGVNDDALRELFTPRLDDVDFALIRQIKMSNQLSDEALEMITDLPRLAGSNAWAVSPQRSATGRALLAADPHLEINRLPAIWYEAVLAWDDRYVMGATLPGCPLFAVARTERLAWGVTYMKGDTVDYFVEDCRIGGETGWQYRRGEEWLDFQVREEEIVRKGTDATRLRVYHNPQGIIDSDLDQQGEGLHLSISWSGMYEGNGTAISAWLDVISSTNTREAMRVARECAQPTLCWVFADRDGHIGLQCCGRFPKRGGGQIGLAPIPAWDSANHWQGWVASELLPSVYDPPEGFLATANEEKNVAGVPMFVTQPLTDYRKRRICERLSEIPKATCEDMQSLQYDLVSVQARDLLAVFLPHLPNGRVKDVLSKWDYSYAPTSCEASLFLKLYRNVIVEVLGHEQGIGWRRMLYICTRAGYSMMVLGAADRLLKREASIWWRGRNKSDLIRRAGERTENEPDQPWSSVNSFHFTDRFFGKHQVGRMLGFNSRRYPMPGNHATPFQGHVLQTATRESTFAPSYHFVTDLGTNEAWTNLPGGPSESRFSKYYKNDVSRWFAGEYKRIRL
ncbi:MAG: penicillin acylase family protein [Planctomycetaceae bacterium]|nr:penicillin acylase family protein [Planctomycetales bacterium]MCB9923375.1 penicillin acylase family protein [Planctomycetaceae bacterium]